METVGLTDSFYIKIFYLNNTVNLVENMSRRQRWRVNDLLIQKCPYSKSSSIYIFSFFIVINGFEVMPVMLLLDRLYIEVFQ